MTCQLCGLGAVQRGYGWRRKLDAAEVPDVVRPIVDRLIAAGNVLSCEECAQFARVSDYNGLTRSVHARHLPYLTRGGAEARAHTPIVAWAGFYRNFLTTANQTDKGEVIDLSAHTLPAIRTWYDLMRVSRFDPAECRFHVDGGDFVAWADFEILGLEGVATRVRGVHAGSRILTGICRAADAHGTRIIGLAEPYDAYGERPSLSLEQLHEWYGRYGFHRIGDSGNHPDAIAREPNPSADRDLDGILHAEVTPERPRINHEGGRVRPRAAFNVAVRAGLNRLLRAAIQAVGVIN